LWGKKHLTPAQIAKKLGISQATVSLRKKYIQEQMDKAVNLLR
jgi:DNA-directed RNA polymerase specialized sigma subunit